MEADSRTTRGIIGDAEARTTFGWISGAITGVFYTIIKAGKHLVLTAVIAKEYVSMVLRSKELIQSNIEAREG